MRLAFASALAFALALASCGYRSVQGGHPEPLAVVLASSQIADAVATDEVVAGVRDELARAGALRSGSGSGDSYPRCEIEVLRADETSEGVSAVPNADGVQLPTARATRVGVVARAWVVRAKDGPRERDTGDVRALETTATAPDARTGTFRFSDALRAASRRAGRRIGTRILGLPTSSD